MTEPRGRAPMRAPKVRWYSGIAAVFALALLPVLSGCGGYDPKSKSTEELIATMEDASVGNPTDKNPTRDPNVVGGWDSGPRCDAAEELGRRKATSAVDLLIAALRDGRVDSCAATALGAMGDARAVLPLLEAFEHGVKLDESGEIDQRGNGGQGNVDLNCDWHDPRLCLPRSYVVRALEEIGSAGLDQVMPQLVPLADAAEWVALEAACYERGSQDAAACAGLARLGVVMTVLADLRDRRAEPVFVEWLISPGVEPASSSASVSALGLRPGDLIDHDPARALAMMYGDDVDHLLPLLQSKETVDIAYGIIAVGKAGTEPALIDGLMQFGDETLASFYLNCGNDQLETAAHDWATANGYLVQQLPPTFSYGGASAKSWGALPSAP